MRFMKNMLEVKSFKFARNGDVILLVAGQILLLDTLETLKHINSIAFGHVTFIL